MKIRAYNLLPGAAFQAGDDRVVVVEVLERDADSEVIAIMGRYEWRPGLFRWDFDYCDVLELLGLVVNADEPDDWDLGV